MNSRLSQSSYYAENNLTPSRSSIEDPSIFQRHWQIRTHLYQDLLAVPLAFLQGKSVLEIGCGTGEAAIVPAILGADMTLIDANCTVESRIDNLFDYFEIKQRIRSKFFQPFEEYNTPENFSMITAEGFLFTLANRDQLLRKICSLLAKGGIAVVSFPDRFGSFFEFIKKTVLWRVYQISKIDDIHSLAALDLAHQLFLKNFETLSSTRNFETWWMDCLVSPFLTWNDCWAYDEILQIVSSENCIFHASTPRIYEPPHLTWYKQVQSPEEQLQAVLTSYGSRKFDLMFGNALQIKASGDVEKLSSEFSNLIRQLSYYFQTLKNPFPPVNFPTIANLAQKCGILDPVLDELVVLFNTLPSEDAKKIISTYNELCLVNKRWGCSYQYLAFRKNF